MVVDDTVRGNMKGNKQTPEDATPGTKKKVSPTIF
jgi:hypothetical protein